MKRRAKCLPSGVRLLPCLLLFAAGCRGDGPSPRAIDDQGADASALAAGAGVAGLLREQIERYPEMELQDLYKLLYQAANGSAHALRDTVAARQRLEEEVAALLAEETGGAAGQGDEPLTERLTSGGELVRVNLRPYLAAGGDPEALWRAFVRSARAHAPSLDSLRVWWNEAETLAASGELPFAPEALHSFYVRQGLTGFPAARHSSHYEETYRPAYRVIAADRLRLSPR